ncbi:MULTISPECIES: DUF1643 domain-containing protein [unclassified Campylobacter]|uniref:DUF1643 domain-containing protein n=1 Tax=unclassified Campylobacter TaxID=2593542 RepID=UPI001474E3F9|nr:MULTISPECIES: DUF1643 domain-containing protein [unclassified Campylobacter]
MDNQIKQDAIFSKDRKYRYVLTRIWDESKPMVAFVGLNPSIADENTTDKTISRCTNLAKFWGYGGFYMLNLFAMVSMCPTIICTADDPIGNENDQFIIEYSDKVDKVICMWGDKGRFNERGAQVYKMLKNKYCLKLNKSGEPSHTRGLGGNPEPIKF